MVFSNLVFLFIFLPVTLLFYFLVGPKLRNLILLGASLFFYAWGEPKYIFLMLFSIGLNYCFGLLIDHYRDRLKVKKLVLTLAIIGNVAILGFYKYINFFVDNINMLLNTNIVMQPIPLPIGISFFTFQAMSYIIDVYRQEAKVQKSVLNLSLYISLFPQLIAGPIVRYNDIANQIQKRIITNAMFADGIRRFIIGLAKKVLIANQLGEIADNIFATNPSELTVAASWIGIIAYTLQIYFDFSGYTDMAIGLGRMFGFKFLENFNYPYIAKSISEFWRRWHISLGSWFKSYVYIPLGGNKGNKFALYRNLLIVWTITGFWHGASWTFMAWGFYYGFIICIEKMGLEKFLKKLWTPLQHIYVLLIVVVGWVFFRADNFTYSYQYIQTMFGFNGTGFIDSFAIAELYSSFGIFALGIIFSMPVFPYLREKIKSLKEEVTPPSIVSDFISSVGYMVLLIVVTAHLVNSTYNPFLYFRF